MNDRKKWIKALDQLWSENYRISQFYRRAKGATTDKTLKAALIRLSSKRAQFTFEIGQQIKELGGNCNSFPITEDIRRSIISLNLTQESTERIITKSILTEKNSIKEYLHALSLVNHGPTREILIRHKASISLMIKDLRNLEAYPLVPENENLKTK
jgi:hypothetical protein